MDSWVQASLPASRFSNGFASQPRQGRYVNSLRRVFSFLPFCGLEAAEGSTKTGQPAAIDMTHRRCWERRSLWSRFRFSHPTSRTHPSIPSQEGTLTAQATPQITFPSTEGPGVGSCKQAKPSGPGSRLPAPASLNTPAPSPASVPLPLLSFPCGRPGSPPARG